MAELKHVKGLDGLLATLKALPPEIALASPIDLSSTGVYAIISAVSGSFYVGSASRSFAKRFKNHRHDLMNGKHHCQPLQNAWNKYGPERMFFIPIEATDPQCAVAREQVYIDKLRPVYNIARVARSSFTGMRHTEAARRLVREAQRSYLSKPGYLESRVEKLKLTLSTEESRKRRIAAQNRPEVAQLRSAASKAMWASDGFRQRNVAAMKFANARPEVKAARSEMRRKLNCERSPVTHEMTKEISLALLNGEKGSVLARKYGLGQSTISRIRKGTHWALPK